MQNVMIMVIQIDKRQILSDADSDDVQSNV